MKRDRWLPYEINRGNWLTYYTLPELKLRLPAERVVLPICSLGTPAEELEQLAPLVLPPLYHEALDESVKPLLLEQIRQCFPFVEGTRDRREYEGEFELVELPPAQHPPPTNKPRILAFSVDTAVEQHGPHLPLATDTIQSYAVLTRLEREFASFVLGPPLDYGHLTWGLPLGLSIDLTPELLSRYVTRYTNALIEWMQPDLVFVVDVHGSPAHREAIVEGLDASSVGRYAFCWLHEPLVPYAFERGDQHAGSVETAIIEQIHPRLVDDRWWPDRIDDLAADQMSLEMALQLGDDMDAFIEYAESSGWNGIVGHIENYFDLRGNELFTLMHETAREEVKRLCAKD